MNVDTFKGLLVSKTTSAGFSWSENDQYKGEGCLLSCRAGFPYYDDDCVSNLFVSENNMQIVFILDSIVPTYDNLKLVNDFNNQVPFLKAAINKSRDNYFLMISSNSITLESEEGAVDKFIESFKYVSSQEVAMFLRPLTVITQ